MDITRKRQAISSGLLSATAIGLAIAAPAFAQPGTAGPGQPAQASSTLSEIVVTAQRREERAQDVPIAITAFSAERLEQMNVTQPQDLYGSVPSLVVGSQGQASRDVQSYSIRGQSTGFLASPAVAVYLNEVPLPASITLNLQGGPGNFVDLENIQVLEGPQGTLFGRNTTGGAVLLVPHKPTNDFEGYVEAGVGNYDLKTFEGVVNLPIIRDKLMVRLVGAFQDRDGYTEDLVWQKNRDNIHWYSGRLGITFRPTDKLDNYLLLYGANSANNGSGNVHMGWNIPFLQSVQGGFCFNPGQTPGPLGGVPCDVYRRQTQIAQEIGPRATRGDLDGFSKIKTWGVINTTSHELTNELTVKNIISYQELRDNYATDQDGTPLQSYQQTQNGAFPTTPIPGLAEFGLPFFGYTNANVGFDLPRDNIKQLTEELQLQGRMLDNHLNFTVGGFYYNAEPASLWGSSALNLCPAIATGLCGQQQARAGVTNQSKAIYGQATFNLGYLAPSLERLRVTAGYRYTWDTIEGFNTSWIPLDPTTGFCVTTGAAVPLGQVESACGFAATLKSSAPTWTLGLDYKPIDNVMLYGKVSRGYKAGGFNTTSVRAETRTFAPEKLTTYEIGFKSDWRVSDIPLRFNASYYYSDYKNIQRPAGDVNPATGAAGAQILAAKATIQGFEMETSIRPIQPVEIGANVSYTHGRYNSFEQVAPFPTFACNGLVQAGGTADFGCLPFQFVTPWIYNIHANVDLPIPEDLGKLSLYISYAHVSEQATSPLGQPPFEPGSILEPYGLLNASLDWRNIAHSGVDASLFVTNATDELYRVSNANVFNSLGVWSTLYGEPRMFGLKLRYRFGARQE